MRFAPLFVCSTALALLGCGQEIVVLDCDGHVDPANDTGPRDLGPSDAGMDAAAPDLGFDDDAGMPDATPDGGQSGCGASPYCITGLTPALLEGIVRAPMILTPVVDNPQSVPLAYRVELSGATRRPGLPPLVMTDVMTSISVDPSSGVVTFIVNDVPTFYATTSFQIRIYAMGPGAMPEISYTGTAVIKGNVVFSGSGDVFAMASDGLPARSVNFTQGRLLTTTSFVRSPRDLLLARDGTLVVYDFGTTPNRLRRFALDAENSLLGDFDYQDANGLAYLNGNDTARGLVQLPDGKFAALDLDSSRTPESKVVVWNENGSYLKTIIPISDSTWNGLSFTDASQIVTLEHANDGKLVTIDVGSGLVSATPLATGLSNGWTVTRSRDGFYYVGLTSAVLRVSPTGARQMVNGIQSGTSDYYQYLAPFGPTQMLITRDYFSQSANVGVVDGTTFNGWLRPTGTSAPGVTPYGIAYLD